MKRLGSFLTLLFITTLFSPLSVYADTVITGNSTVSNTSTTEVNGNGTTHVHMESTVNGVTKTLDSDQPGTYTLNNSDSNSQSSSTSETPDDTITPTPTPSVSPTSNPTHTPKKSHITKNLSGLQQIFHNTIQKLLSLFHL